MRRWRWLLTGLVLVGVAGAGGWRFASADQAPGKEAGERWVDEYVAFVTSPRLLDADRQTALALLPDLSRTGGPANGAPNCPEEAEWTRRPSSDPVVISQKLVFWRNKGSACDDFYVAEVTTGLRRSQGVTPARVMKRLAERYGRPVVTFLRDDRASFTWQPTPWVSVTLAEFPNTTDFSLELHRLYGRRAHVPDAAESERWMDGFVATITGEAFRDARGPAAVALFRGLHPLSAGRPGGCPGPYNANPVPRPGEPAAPPPADPLFASLTLLMDAQPGEPCEQARVLALTATIWRTRSVDSAAFAERLTARLGEPVARRGDYALKIGRIETEWRAPNLAVVVRDSMPVGPSAPLDPADIRTFDVQVTTQPQDP